MGREAKRGKIYNQWKRKAESKNNGKYFHLKCLFFFFSFSEQEAGDPLILMAYSIPEASALLKRGKCFQRFQISWVMTPLIQKSHFLKND